MVFVRDTRDKIGKHNELETYLTDNGHKIVRSKMYVGDVTLLEKQNVCIDLKFGLAEVYKNIIQENRRFKDECVRAREAGIVLVVLIAEENISRVEDVGSWRNPRREKWFMVNNAQKKGKMLHVKQSARPPVPSEQLQRAMSSMSERYGVSWSFSRKEEVGKKVVEILTEGIYD